MTSRATRRFWTCFDSLPQSVREQARVKYRLWLCDPFHPSLHFKEVTPDLWSARINRNYRALARRKDDLIVWFWIGLHREYEQMISHG